MLILLTKILKPIPIDPNRIERKCQIGPKNVEFKNGLANLKSI